MASIGKPTIGKMRCLCCGEEVAVKLLKSERVSFSCQWCGFQAYAWEAKADKIIRGRMTPLDDAPPAERPAAAQPAKPAEKPQAAAKPAQDKTIFDFFVGGASNG